MLPFPNSSAHLSFMLIHQLNLHHSKKNNFRYDFLLVNVLQFPEAVLLPNKTGRVTIKSNFNITFNIKSAT